MANAATQPYDRLEGEAVLPLISDENLLIVDVVLGGYRLASDIFLYASPEVTVVPLQALFDAVEYPIDVDPLAAKAHGWFQRENNVKV